MQTFLYVQCYQTDDGPAFRHTVMTVEQPEVWTDAAGVRHEDWEQAAYDLGTAWWREHRIRRGPLVEDAVMNDYVVRVAADRQLDVDTGREAE